MKQKIFFIINPISGIRKKLKQRLPQLIEEHIDKERFDYAIKYTEAGGHARVLAKEAMAEGFDIVAIAGGDGSVNEVASALKNTDMTMAILPFGSGNGLARHLRIPLNVPACLDLINNGKVSSIDLCKYKEMIFCSNAGMGFDAFATKLFEKSPFRGFFGYAQSILRSVYHYPFFEYTMMTEKGRETSGEAFIITAFNANQYGYNIKLAPAADLQDGMLDVFILKKFPKWRAPLLIMQVLRGKTINEKYAGFIKASKVKLTTNKRVHFQVDGESLKKEKEVEIEIIPKALKIIVP